MGSLFVIAALSLLLLWYTIRSLWRGVHALWQWNSPVGRWTVLAGAAALALLPAAIGVVRSHLSEAYFREVLREDLGVDLPASASLVASGVEPAFTGRVDDCATAVFKIPPEHWHRLFAHVQPHAKASRTVCDAPLRDHLYGAPQARGRATAGRHRKIRWETYEQSHRLYVEVRRRH